MYEGIKDIFNLLEESRLKETLIQLQGICSNTSNWELRSKVEETLTAYNYMLQYTSQGMSDPNREGFYKETLLKAYELIDSANITLLTTQSNGTFFERRRILALHPPKSYAELQLQLEAYTEDMGTAPLIYSDPKQYETETDKIIQTHETALIELFNKVWTTIHWSETEAKDAKNILESVMISPNDLAVMTSAATLSLLRVFDPQKMHFLMDAYLHENPIVNQRALVGIVLVLLNQEKRFSLYPDLNSRLSLMFEKEETCRDLKRLQLQLLQTLETTKIDRKMQEEIIPEMIRNAKQLKDTKFRFDEPEDMERNPEWQEWIDQSGFTDKVRMMNEWQQEGADLYMSSFSQLKNYPFFHEIAHWFYPFDKNQPVLKKISKELDYPSLSPVRLIASSNTFCNSDKYSFCLATIDMPFPARKNAIKDMQAHMDEEKMEELKSAMNVKPDPKSISRQYIQDLYRFFKLWKQKREEVDIFQENLEFWNNNILKTLIYDNEAFAKEVGDFLFVKEKYDKAESIYGILTEKNTDNAEIWQKMGFIFQKRHCYDIAIEYLLRADLIQPDNVWTNLHLAQCYYQYSIMYQKPLMEKALAYYQKVEAIQPDNLKITIKIGQCLTEMEKYDEALTYFYKAEYLDKQPDNARRAIGWSLFMNKKYEESLKYYQLLLENPSAKAQDWMNTGHVYLALQQIPQAKEHYLKAKAFEKDHKSFILKFQEDYNALRSQGLSPEVIQIVLDLLV